MNLQLDEYAHLDSPLHRWEPRSKLVTLLLVLFAFSFVRDVRLIPVMLAVTIGLYAVSRLPLSFLLTRLRYPGYFLLMVAVLVPFLAGETVIVQVGPLALRQEGLQEMLLIVSRFTCMLTVGLVLFGTAPFLTTIKTMRRLGLPTILADMTLLSFRYLFEISDTLARMERAMRLRGYRANRLSRRGVSTLAALAGSLLIRSYEQSERIYKAMLLRGYGRSGQQSTNGKAQSLNGQSAERVEMVDNPVLHVSNLGFAYPDRPPILKDVNVRIMPGERVGLIGPNGAGKTSLFWLTCGLLNPVAGEVTLFGGPVTPGSFHPEVGLVFQNPDDQLFSSSVWDDVAFGPQNSGLSESEVEQRVAEVLAITGMEELAQRPPHHLSGGEKRMVSIASVLAMRPQLVLYDEPDANLDIRSRRRLIRFLQASEQTILVASHDLELILEVCDRVLLLDEGRIVADGNAHEIMDDAALMEKHGLEKPHMLIPHVEPHHQC